MLHRLAIGALAVAACTRTTLDSAGDVFDDDGTKVPVQTHD